MTAAVLTVVMGNITYRATADSTRDALEKAIKVHDALARLGFEPSIDPDVARETIARADGTP